MRMVIRSIPAAALALCLTAAHLTAQQPGSGNFQWYLGAQGGVLSFDTPSQDRTEIPSFGGQALIVAKRAGLMLSYEEGVGSDETSSYTDANGVQNVTFNNIRKYQAVLMAFPFRAAAQPYLGLGYGIIHVVNPTPTSPAAFQSDAVELGSSGFMTFVGGLTIQVGRLMAFGQYEVTTSPSSHAVTDGSGTVVASGQLLVGPTHTVAAGLRIGLGSSKDGSRSAGGY